MNLWVLLLNQLHIEERLCWFFTVFPQLCFCLDVMDTDVLLTAEVLDFIFMISGVGVVPVNKGQRSCLIESVGQGGMGSFPDSNWLNEEASVPRPYVSCLKRIKQADNHKLGNGKQMLPAFCSWKSNYYWLLPFSVYFYFGVSSSLDGSWSSSADPPLLCSQEEKGVCSLLEMRIRGHRPELFCINNSFRLPRNCGTHLRKEVKSFGQTHTHSQTYTTITQTLQTGQPRPISS